MGGVYVTPETLYPIGYGTSKVTIKTLEARFGPHMHPEALRRGLAFLVSKGGLLGVGGGYRPPGAQPDGKPGFAPPGKSFHEGQEFPSGRFYVAWDLVAVNPGKIHRSPTWAEVPKQGGAEAHLWGVHANVSTEPWHLQPIEIDGYDSWVRAGRPDLQKNRPLPGIHQPAPVENLKPAQKPTVQPSEPFVSSSNTSGALLMAGYLHLVGNAYDTGSPIRWAVGPFHKKHITMDEFVRLIADGFLPADADLANPEWWTVEKLNQYQTI